MKTKGLFGLFLIFMATAYGQKYEAGQGDIANLSGIKLYKVDFEYAKVLEVPKYGSEETFIEQHIQKLNDKDPQKAKDFKSLWFENRKNIYEPTFIKEFNDFRLRGRHVTVSKNYTEARHSMLVTVNVVYPGYEDFIWDKAAELEVTIQFMDHESPNIVLFATKTVKVHGRTKGDVFDKLTTAYGELGRWTAKFLCRKT